MWVLWRATSPVNSFCSNFEKQVARFLLPVFPYLKPKPKEFLSLIEQRTDGALKFVEIRPTFGQETSGLIWTKTALQEPHQLHKQMNRRFSLFCNGSLLLNKFYLKVAKFRPKFKWSLKFVVFLHEISLYFEKAWSVSVWLPTNFRTLRRPLVACARLSDSIVGTY